MADLPKEGDEARNEYLNKALHANEEAASGAKFSDLFNKDSTIYERPDKQEKLDEAKKKEEERQKAPPPKLTTDAEGYPIIESMHTYREDLADIVSKDKLSLSRIAMMQGEVARNAPEALKPEEKKGRRFLIAGGVLLVLGIVTIAGVSILGKKSASPASTETQKEKYIIFSETKQDMNITNATKTEIGATIKKLAGNFKEQDSVMEIIPTINGNPAVERAALQDLWNKTSVRIPDDLLRSLYSRFFLGLYSRNGATHPFALIYTSSYDIAYPAMLRWEGFMQDDLNWLFDTRPQSGTTTPPLFFKDKVVSNLDTRSFEDASGKSAFFYLFLDQNTILFARTADTVRMVQDRIRQAKFQ